MKNPSMYVAGILFVVAGFLASPLPAGETGAGEVESIEVQAALEYVAQHDDAIIVDVRTPAEFDLSHITGAMNVDVQDEEFVNLVAGLDKDRTYLVHCTKNPADGRSSRALETLRGLGFRNLYSLEGGYVAWKEAALPLTEAAAEE